MKHIPGFEQIFGCPVYLVSDEERFLICKKPPFPMLGAYRKFRGDPSAKNGCIFLFEEYYTLPAEYRHYIVWHEAGHLHSYPDRSEEAADRWAIRNCTEPDGKKGVADTSQSGCRNPGSNNGTVKEKGHHNTGTQVTKATPRRRQQTL